MEPQCSYIIKIFIDKKYALPYRVLDALVAHFMRFLEDSRVMPVIWHQTLLAFVQRLVITPCLQPSPLLHLYKEKENYLVYFTVNDIHVSQFPFCKIVDSQDSPQMYQYLPIPDYSGFSFQ